MRVALRLSVRRAKSAYAEGPASIAIHGAPGPVTYRPDERWLLSLARVSIASPVPRILFLCFRIGSGRLEEQNCMYSCIILSAITIVYDCLTILTDEEQSHSYTITTLAFIVFIYLVCFSLLVLFVLAISDPFFLSSAVICHSLVLWDCGEFCRYLACFSVASDFVHVLRIPSI